MNLKKCKTCGESELSKMKKGNTQNICKKCDNEKSRLWREKNKLKMKESNRKWREKNKEKAIICDNIGKHSQWLSYIEFRRCKICNTILAYSPDKKASCFKCKEIKRKRKYIQYKSSDEYKNQLKYQRKIYQRSIESKLETLKCIECNNILNAKRLTKRYCNNCKQKKENEYKKGTNNHRKRARFYGCVAETVNKYKVFKRDKYLCKMCGIKVQASDSSKDNMAHLDHIVPLSKGGAHTYSNVQTLCAICNVNKSNKLIGQLTLSF